MQKTWWPQSRLPMQSEQDIRQTGCAATSGVHILRSSTFCVYCVVLRNSLPTAQPRHYTVCTVFYSVEQPVYAAGHAGWHIYCNTTAIFGLAEFKGSLWLQQSQTEWGVHTCTGRWVTNEINNNKSQCVKRCKTQPTHLNHKEILDQLSHLLP